MHLDKTDLIKTIIFENRNYFSFLVRGRIIGVLGSLDVVVCIFIVSRRNGTGSCGYSYRSYVAET